jgi:hypothetical protein
MEDLLLLLRALVGLHGQSIARSPTRRGVRAVQRIVSR